MAKTNIPTALQQHLDSGATTLCVCWRVTRKDGVVMGFTNHDGDLAFDGTTFEAEAGFTASMVQQALGLSVDNMEVVGAFNSNFITETDLISGVYDDADIEVYLVNWQDTAQRSIEMFGSIGEVTQKGIEFTAELRSLTHRLNQKIGRVYSRDSDREGVDTSTQITATVSNVITRSLFEFTGATQASDFYNRGLVTWISGNNDNAQFDVKTYVNASGTATVALWDQAVSDIQVGDTFTLVASWPRTAEEHKERYGDLIDFRGFPHMPGEDFITTYAEQGGENQDGGALVF